MRRIFKVSPFTLLLLFFTWLPLAILMVLPVQEIGAPIILGLFSIPLIFLWYRRREYLLSLAFLASFYPLSLLLYLVRDSVPPSVVGFIVSSMFLIPAYFDEFEKSLWRLYILVFALVFSFVDFDLKVGALIMFLGVSATIEVENPKYLSLGLFGMYTFSSIKLLTPGTSPAVLAGYLIIGGLYHVIAYRSLE